MAMKAALYRSVETSSLRMTEAAVAVCIEAVAGKHVATKKDGRRRWRDEGSVHGLCLQVGKQGATWYRISRRPGSDTKVATRIGDATAMRVADARKAAMKLAAGDSTAAAQPMRVSSSGITADDAFENYLADCMSGEFVAGRKRTSANTLQSYRYLWNPHVKPKYGEKSLHKLAQDIPRILASLRHKPVVANRLQQVLANLYRWAAGKGHWRKPHPLIDPFTGKTIRKQSVRSRARYFSVEEAARFMQWVEAHEAEPWPDFWRLLLLIGCRVGNLRHCRWEELDLVTRVWKVPTSKTGEALELPLSDAAVEIFSRRRKESKSPFVFPRRWNPNACISDCDHAWVRATTGAKISGVRIHDLRRTAGSWATQAGVALPSVGQYLGHKSVTSTSVYARSSHEAARQAANAVATLLPEASPENVNTNGKEEGGEGGEGQRRKKAGKRLKGQGRSQG